MEKKPILEDGNNGNSAPQIAPVFDLTQRRQAMLAKEKLENPATPADPAAKMPTPTYANPKGHIVDLRIMKLLRQKEKDLVSYRERILQLSKSDLLSELLHYQEDFLKNPLDVMSTLQGQELMRVLETKAELGELRELSREFKAKLDHRLDQQLFIHTKRLQNKTSIK